MFKQFSHRFYEVGGSLRNEFLGLPPNDIDYAAEFGKEEFEHEFPEAKLVGNSFPVYILNGFEVALTRKEVSDGSSTYVGSSVTDIGVPIALDLSRRDFSFNSIARNVESGTLVDPFGGVEDIKLKRIRTINNDFVKDDPLRVYRLARFAAEFGFSIEESTAEIVRRDAHLIKNVLPERVHLELEKVYARSAKPSVFFTTLLHLGVLKYHFKPLYVAHKVSAGPLQYHHGKSVFEHLLDSFDKAKAAGHSFDVAVASLFHDLGKVITPKDILPKHIGHDVRHKKLATVFLSQHRFTAKQQELILAAGALHMRFHILTDIKSPIKIVRFYKEIKRHFEELIQVAQNDHGVSKEELQILFDVKRAFEITSFEIPASIKDKKAFAEQRFAETYKKIRQGEL